MPLSPDLDPVFEDAGKQFNVDPALLKATALGESHGDPRAVSPAGAGGLMQLMPETAKGLGVTDPFDEVQSIYGGAAYLAQGLDKYGDPAKALMYYHGGPDESKWGQKTAAYPAYIASLYQPSKPPTAGGGNAAKPAAIADGDNGQIDSLPVMPRDYVFGKNPATGAARSVPDYGTPQPGQSAINTIGGRPTLAPPGYKPPAPVLPTDLTNSAPLHGSRAVPGAAMDGIEQLAAAGQPPTAAAAPAQSGMSDDDLLNGFVNGTLPFMQKPQAAPDAAPAGIGNAPPSAAGPANTPAATAPVPLADPTAALYPPALRQHLMTFPEGQQTLAKIIDEEKAGYQRNRDGTFSPIRGGPADPSAAWQLKAGETAGGNLSAIGPNGVVPLPGAAQSANTMKANEAAGTHLQTVGPDGTVSNMPGAVGAGAAVKGAETEAEQAAKAPFTPTEAKPGNRALTVQDLVDMRNGKVPAGMKPGDLPGVYNDPGIGEATKSNEALYKEYAGMVANNPIAEQNLRNAAEAFRYFQSGAGAELSAKAGAWMKASGIDPAKLNLNDPAKVEEAKKAATQAIFAQMAGLKNPALGEYGMLENASAQPTLQPEAAKMIMGNSLAKLAYQNDFFQHMANHRTEHGSMMGYDPSAFISGAAQLMPGYQDAAMKSLPAFKGEGNGTQPQPAAPSVREGQTATNPQTKERLIFRGGQWTPLQ